MLTGSAAGWATGHFRRVATSGHCHAFARQAAACADMVDGTLYQQEQVRRHIDQVAGTRCQRLVQRRVVVPPQITGAHHDRGFHP
jgi:hypothetical protein